ncbi:hypothetical protein DMB42_11505 [Nonomuraea sp. WAC 01424]|uniref:hypothetical protein n=1 Tax=Nonomuraea sp. WAC 01424 TaxID=2203200 RepID=UPI000F7870F1|nr:hypothetical protein [Nonomuraea sp. WAC 01424]RSN12797.1 hypothetical protein DMB42_11505 [Nonomuraea sp. WAC 01424]
MATLRSISSGQGTGTAFTVSKPPGASVGDILIAFHSVADISPFGMLSPVGGVSWQLLGSRSDTEWGGTKVWWKVAGPAEPASYTFRQGGGDLYSGGIASIVAISDHDGATPLISSAENGDDPLVGCPSVSPTAAPGVTLRWAAAVTQLTHSWTSPSGHTEQVERTSADLTATLASRARPEVVGTGTATFTFVASFPPVFSHGFTVDVGGIGGLPPEPPPSIPPSKDVHYKYDFCDLRTDNFICTLDPDDVSYSRLIGEPGSFQASIDVTNRDIADQVAKVVPRWVMHDSEPDSLSTGPGRTVCHVYRNGIIWGSYAIWKAIVSSDGRGAIKVSLTGASLESYLNAVEIRDDLTYEATDQLEIARQLIDEMQALGNASIGLTSQSGTSGVNRDRTYLAGETATFGQRLRELADVDDGFEWLIHTEDPGVGARTKLVKLGYPKLGTNADHVFSQPGNVTGWSQDIDGLRGATSYRARGESISSDASTASTPLMSDPQNATAHLAAGWPRIDKTIDYSTVKEVDTLNAYAARWAAERPGAVRVHQVSVRLDDTEWTPANLGDYARVMLVNDWWPIADGGASFNNRWRVIGINVRATSRDSQESATLVFEEEVEI